MDESGALLKYCAVFEEQPVKSMVNKTHVEIVLQFNAICNFSNCLYLTIKTCMRRVTFSIANIRNLQS